MNKQKRKLPCYNKTFPILLFIATMFMGIGYAATTSVSLEITGEATALKQDGIFITEVYYLNDNNALLENSKINSAYQTTLNSQISLSPTDPNSSITYSITLYNSTDENYYFQNVEYYEDEITYSNPNIVYTLNGINQHDILNSHDSITFNITFSYKDNILAEDNSLKSYLNFKFIRKYTITYNNLINTTNYQTEIYEGDTLIVDLTPSNVSDVHVYINGADFENFTFIDNIITIPNVTSNLTIQGIGEHHYDVPVTDKDTNFLIVDSSNGEEINVRDLFEMQFTGVNGSNKHITKIELVVTYTSTTGSKQNIISTLTHNNISHTQTLNFQGKVTNETLTITFDNLQIGIYETFTLTNSNQKLTNGNIEIIKEELKIYFEE